MVASKHGISCRAAASASVQATASHSFVSLVGRGRPEPLSDGTVDSTEIIQENHYYAFGMEMNGGWQKVLRPEQRYQYNGKEHIAEIGLFDYGARWYDAAIARWGTVDPLAETMAGWSSYNYTFGNPISFTDPTGMAPEGMLDTKDDNLGLQTSGRGNSDPSQGQSFIGSNSQPVPSLGSSSSGCDDCPTYTLPEVAVTASRSSGNQQMGVLSGVNWDREIGFKEGLIPLYGSGRSAIRDFRNGSYGRGTFNSLLAISDVFLLKSIVTGIGKGGFGALMKGNQPWSAKQFWDPAQSYRAYYGSTGFADKGQHLHHWLIQQKGPIGKYIPNFIKHQMFNLTRMPSSVIHSAIHGKGALKSQQIPLMLRYGLPNYVKAAPGSVGGRFINSGSQ